MLSIKLNLQIINLQLNKININILFYFRESIYIIFKLIAYNTLFIDKYDT